MRESKNNMNLAESFLRSSVLSHPFPNDRLVESRKVLSSRVSFIFSLFVRDGITMRKNLPSSGTNVTSVTPLDLCPNKISEIKNRCHQLNPF